MLAVGDVGAGQDRKEPIFIGDKEVFAKEHFLLPSHYASDLQSVMIPKGLIEDRIEKLAMDISEVYGDESVHVICVLKGSRGFFGQLCNVLNRIRRYTKSHKNPPYIEHYVRLKSYQNAESTGKVQVISDDLDELAGKHVLVVEDIIDTGRTLSTFCKQLISLNPKSLRIAALLEKRAPRTMAIKADFAGFSIPDEFVVGFSLDYNEYYRDLDHIAVMAPAGIAKHKVDDHYDPYANL
jgi:hypoxanthine phosphoribosyltransferase